MNPTAALHAFGQSLWLDNITRALLDDGTLQGYVDRLSVTGLTSNPTIFQHAIAGTDAYDADIAASTDADPGALFIRMALADLARAADLFAPAHKASGGVDGWVSMEVSPLLADDAAGTLAAVKALHAQGGRDNLFIKIPGTQAGLTAIEEATFAGIPINVTLLFSDTQTIAAAEARLRGIQRRLATGLDPAVHSVVSLFVSRWDVAVASLVPPALHNRLGIAMAGRTLRAFRALLDSPLWRKLEGQGVPTQRLLWASTGTKDPAASDVLYIEALAAPGTINTIPDKTLKAFADHGRVGPGMAADGGDCDAEIARFEAAGIDTAALAAQLQREGAAAFVTSWNSLMQDITAKRDAAKRNGGRP